MTESCPPARAFRFEDGAVARSLTEFAQRLVEASPTTVAYHRAHFAPWLREVMGDAPLARRFEAFGANDEGVAPDVLKDILVSLVRTRLSEPIEARSHGKG